jgi:hypothetical protein
LKIVVIELLRSVWARPKDDVPNQALASVFSLVSLNSQKLSLAHVLHTLNIT